MQHMPAGSGYRSVTSDLIQHPPFTDGETEEQRREGPLGASKSKWEQSFPSWDAGDLPNKDRAPQEGLLLWKKRQPRTKVSGELCLWPGWLG